MSPSGAIVASSFDRAARWRASAWRAFVRSLPCSCRDPRCRNCNPWKGAPTRVVAAHFRTTSTGLSLKPDDFLIYPLSDQIHRVYHDGGQPGIEWQVERVAETLREGFRRGVLSLGHPEPPEGAIPW